MTHHTTDAARPFVKAANDKEAYNAQRRILREERAQNQHPIWFVLAALLTLLVAVFYFWDDNETSFSLFVLLAAVHLWLAYRQWRRRKQQ